MADGRRRYKSDRKDYKISVKLSEKDMDILKAALKRTGMTASAYIRELIRTGGNIDTSYPEDRARAIRVIAGIANNINQAVKLGNSQGRLYYSDIDKLQNSLDDVSAIFNHAVNFYHLPSNPAQKAGNMGKEEHREMLFWTKEEYLKFADVMMDKPVSYYAFEILYWCGLRMGELLALTPADFNFETHTLRINKSYQRLHREDVITPPKTLKSNRTIKMPQFLCDEMQDYLKMLYEPKEDERIFTISKSYLHHEMNRGSKVSGVKRIRVHDLRHSHVSLLINMGFTVLAIADRMGHESIDITYRYAHLFPSEQTQMAEQLDIERMEKLNGEKSGQ